MNVNGKYLKDESGDTFSPITSVDTIFKGNIKLLDLIYPVGTYYETDNGDFNPNTSWGGIWSLDTSGTVLVSEGLYNEDTVAYQVGETFGNQWISLTTQNLPAHTHSIGSHNHTFSATTSSNGVHTHSMYYVSDNTTGNRANRMGTTATHDGTRNDIILSSGAHTHTVSGTTGGKSLTTNSTGNGQSINIVQPSKVVYRWHRTA